MDDAARPSGSSNRKRSFLEDVDSNKAPPQKRVRFPKGKKVKTADFVVDEEAIPSGPKNPRVAAKDRATRRNQLTAELFDEDNRGICDDISRAEVQYEDDEPFVDDGIPIEPFNLSKEREEGYFDDSGNYVEYIKENEIKDAWLDSVEVHKKFSGKQPMRADEEDAAVDLSSGEIARIKRRIADVLQPGETVLLALRRLKGTSNNKKEKMAPGTKLVFDQLTEDAMKLLENGDYDVYNEKQESFQREAEGYERLARARGQVISMNSGVEKSQTGVENLVSNGTEMASSSSLFDVDAGPPKQSDVTTANNGDDDLDMFAEDDENATVNPASTGTGMVSRHDLENQNQPSEGLDLQNDYTYDESSGYYYSSSSGYYYDPSSGLYCCAASGQWYSYNGESGTYEEVQQAASVS